MIENNDMNYFHSLLVLSAL